MVKAKTSVVQKKSTKNTPVKPLKKGVKVTPHDPLKELLNEALIRDAIWECLQRDDSAGVMEVLLRRSKWMQHAVMPPCHDQLFTTV